MSAQPSALAATYVSQRDDAGNAPSPAVAALQNQWYNTLAAQVGANGDFQIIQPNAPIPPSATDDLVWAYFNNLPPATLTSNLILSGGNQFYSDYSGLMSQLTSNALANFQTAVGSYYPLWIQYVEKLDPMPTSQQLPATFFNWAEINAPSVAGAGRSTLQAALLDPIFLAQTMASNTAHFVNNTPNFTQGALALFKQLPGGTATSFTFDSNTASSNVSNTWAQGNGGAFFGIFGSGDSSSSTLSETFASAQVTVAVSIANLFTFVTDPAGPPDGWYSSAALGQAFAAQSGGAPWEPNANPNWASTFGTDGNMQYFVSSIIVADGITATITSAAQYSAEQITQINQQNSSGFWPFYWSSGSSSQTSTATQNADGTMSYTVTSVPGVPVVIGAMVVPASTYIAG